MLERKGPSAKNKKYYVSQEYIRKVFESNNSQKKINSKNNYSDFKNFKNRPNTNISNDQPLVLFNKPNSNNSNFSEKKVKKDLFENKRYLNDDQNKRKLLKYNSYHSTGQNNFKNLFFSSDTKNKSKESNNLLNSKTTSFNKDLNCCSNQKYSNSLKKVNNRPKIMNKEEKVKKNKLFNSVNLQDFEFRDIWIQKLTNKNIIAKKILESMKVKKMTEINRKEVDIKRKKDYLEQNNISYEKDSNIENEKNENINEVKTKKIINKNNNKELKDIKLNNKRITNLSRRENYKNNNDEDVLNNKKMKKRYKEFVNQFEFLHKIKKEFNIFRKSKNKDKNNKTTKIE